jgi:arginase
MNYYNIILACCKNGQKKLGVDKAPFDIFRLISKYNYPNIKTTIIDSKFFDKGVGYNAIYKQSTTSNISNKNYINIVLGGDHSVGHPSVSASLYRYKKDLRVFWVDAHADINTFETSESKNTHGMPVGYLSGLMRNIYDEYLEKKQLVYYGVRDMDKEEPNHMRIMNFENKKNVDEVIEEMEKSKKIHISFDIDSIDPKYITHTGTPVKEGIYYGDVKRMIEYGVKTNKLVGLDITELNMYEGKMTKEDKQETLEIVNDIISPLFRKRE